MLYIFLSLVTATRPPKHTHLHMILTWSFNSQCDVSVSAPCLFVTHHYLFTFSREQSSCSTRQIKKLFFRFSFIYFSAPCLFPRLKVPLNQDKCCLAPSLALPVKKDDRNSQKRVPSCIYRIKSHDRSREEEARQSEARTGKTCLTRFSPFFRFSPFLALKGLKRD